MQILQSNFEEQLLLLCCDNSVALLQNVVCSVNLAVLCHSRNSFFSKKKKFKLGHYLI